MAANGRDAINVGLWFGRRVFRRELEGLGWFLIVGTPVIFILQEIGVLSGPRATSGELIGGIGFVLAGVVLVVLNRRMPRRELGLRHVVLSERDEQRRYVPVCSCGWTGEAQETVEGLLLAARAHKEVAALEPRQATDRPETPGGLEPP